MNVGRCWLLVVPLVACAEAADPSAAKEKGASAAGGPNVIVVSIDSLRADHLSAYGYERQTSPFLDGLAEEGLRFESAISTTSWTLPAHAAMFTGLYDSTHGLVDNGQRLADGHVTIAELLQSRGYHTAGFFGGPYLHPTFGLAQGFEVYESCMTTTDDGASGEAVRREARAEESRSHVDVTGPRTREAVANWVVSKPPGPFFLFLHMWDVHYDYLPPPEYVEQFSPNYDGPVDGRDVMGEGVHADMPAEDLAHLIALYDAEIRFTDQVLREIFATLETAQLLDNTYVIVTADHGEEFFEHGGKGHQHTLYDEVLRVPLIIWGPGIEPGVVKDQVRLVDLFATIAGMANVEGDTPLVTQGRDLAPYFRGETMEPVEALAELLVNDNQLRALRTDAHKFIVDEKTRQSQFFQLRNDPAERQGLGSIEMVVDPNRERIRALLNDTVERGTRLRRFLGSRAPGEADAPEDVQELLRSLGYLDSGDAGADDESE